jgi:hypothetical protein
VSKFKDIDALIAPTKLKRCGLFNFKNMDAIFFEIGYEVAIQSLKNFGT